MPRKDCSIVQLGPVSERGDHDFYSTDYKATAHLFAVLKKHRIILPHTIIEPSVGKGHIAKVCKVLGHDVICYDVVDRGYPGTILQDWETVQRPALDHMAIIMNPPYSRALEHLSHAIDMLHDGEYCCALLRLQFLETRKRKIFFEKYPMRYVAVFSFRILCAKNDEEEARQVHSAIAFAWYIWQKGFVGNPELLWI